MRSPIEEAFHRAKRQMRCAFIPYLTGGFPDVKTCEEILIALAQNGADLIEVGIPFSDPLADGPTIQWASRQALEAGITPEGVFRIIAGARSFMKKPLIVMTYWNPVLRMGPGEFAARATEAGVAGVIVPDLPPEEANVWVEAAMDKGLETIFLVSPNTPQERLNRILRVCRGFVYYVSLTGVTGSVCDVSPELLEKIMDLKARSHLSVAVGFGISTAEQANVLGRVADGVIVGSALIREIQGHQDARAKLEAACNFATSMSQALRQIPP